MIILIINCSVLKHPTIKKGPARDIYTGPLITLGIKYAEMHGWKPLILSSRYGIITPDTIIETYDKRMDRPYSGPWPTESGYWLGSQEYFANAPSHIIRLLPSGMSYGQQKSFLNQAVNPHRYGR